MGEKVTCLRPFPFTDYLPLTIVVLEDFPVQLKFPDVPLPGQTSIEKLIDEQVALLGGEVTIAGYGFPGSDELARNVARALEGNDAALLANHGVVCCGKTLSHALRNAILVERLAQTYLVARMVGKPYPLPQESVELQQLVYKTIPEET